MSACRLSRISLFLKYNFHKGCFAILIKRSFCCSGRCDELSMHHALSSENRYVPCKPHRRLRLYEPITLPNSIIYEIRSEPWAEYRIRANATLLLDNPDNSSKWNAAEGTIKPICGRFQFNLSTAKWSSAASNELQIGAEILVQVMKCFCLAVWNPT